MARMILMATLVLFSVSMASTTLPNVPWPSRRTVRSNSNWSVKLGSEKGMNLTAPINHVIRNDDVVTLFVVTGSRAFRCLVKMSMLRNENEMQGEDSHHP